ncbi:MAG: lysophospholipid acyltransferase family protein [Devosiaceae bacterium]|nr:lysophospholipid acyltransferase family protein [Devosiaceae bacterium MH13]
MSAPWYKRFSRHPRVQHIAGNALASYVRFVHATSRAQRHDLGDGADVGAHLPGIFTFWHGEHFMTAMGVRPEWNMHVMISRSGDGTINAIAAEKLGLKTVRGAGETKRGRAAKGNAKGGMTAYRAFVRLLEQGASVAMTADVPKIARVVSPGLVRLAAATGRPIVPAAYVTHPHISLSSWDRASLNLPFTRAAYGANGPITVDLSQGDEQHWCALIKERLDAITEHCYAQCGLGPDAARLAAAGPLAADLRHA